MTATGTEAAKAAFRRAFDRTPAALAAPASAAELRSVEEAIGTSLPLEFRALWELAGGQREHEAPLIQGMRFLSPRESIDELGWLRGLVDLMRDDASLQSDAGVSQAELADRFVPLAGSDGDLIFLSHASGRVFRSLKRDGGEWHLLAASLAEFFERIGDSDEQRAPPRREPASAPPRQGGGVGVIVLAILGLLLIGWRLMGCG